MVKGKKGEELTTPIILMLALTIMVFVILFVFVSQASSGALIYESVYAKQIAFFIDAARPNTDLTLDFSKAVKIAEKNNLNGEALKNLVQINEEKNLVKVSLRGQNGKSMQYFSDYRVLVSMEGSNLVLKIREVLDE
jgi:hypothetical protein